MVSFCRHFTVLHYLSAAPLNKWTILHTALSVSKQLCKDTVNACVLLHNVVRSKNGHRSDEIYVMQNRNDVNRAACSLARQSASDVRDRFAGHFVSRGRSITVANEQTLILGY
jgi:hypothetical protein